MYRATVTPLSHAYTTVMSKQREYGNRTREVENGFFTPLVSATTGGMGQEATLFYKRLTDRISEKNTMYSKIMTWNRCNLLFSLL